MTALLRRTLLAVILAAATLAANGPAWAAPIAQDEKAAVIFSYHRVGEDHYPDNNIRREQFEAHIRELKSGAYNVMPLPAVIATLKKGEALPPRTVVLTFDGGYYSVYDYAAPLLIKNGLPFTVFIGTDRAARVTPEYMNWNDIKKLARNDLVTVGLHPAGYQRLGTQPEAEILRQINSARAAYRDNLGTEARYFAYPFGEYSKTMRDIVEKQGFDAAFGEQSGVAYAGADMLALPRFPMTESFGGLDRFLMTANALPLPTSDISPADPHLATPHPTIGFTVEAALKGQIKKLSCFVAGQGKPSIQVVGETRVEIRLEKPFTTERGRLNCTLPATAADASDEPTWRWFGMLFSIPGNEYVPSDDTDDNVNAVAASDDSRG